MEIVVNLFLVRSRDCWIGIGLAWSLSMRDWLLIGRLLWIGCVTCVQFILRRDTSVRPYSRLVPRLWAGLSSDWRRIDIRFATDWHDVCQSTANWCRSSFDESETYIEWRVRCAWCEGCILRDSNGVIQMDWQFVQDWHWSNGRGWQGVQDLQYIAMHLYWIGYKLALDW